MNPGIVLAIGLIAVPGVVAVAYAIGRRRDAMVAADCAFGAGIATVLITLGFVFLAAAASRCGMSEGRWQWRGNVCVDTKAEQR